MGLRCNRRPETVQSCPVHGVLEAKRERMCPWFPVSTSTAPHTHRQWLAFHQPYILSLPQRATDWRSSLRSTLWHSPEAEPPKPCRQPDYDYLEKALICFSREQLAHEGNQALRIRLITLQAAEESRARSLQAYVLMCTDRAINQLVYLYILSLRIRSQCLSLLLISVFTGRKAPKRPGQCVYIGTTGSLLLSHW